MAKPNKVETQLLRSDLESLPDNVVGAALILENADIEGHSGLFIKYEGVSKLFHFTGEDVLLQETEEIGLIYFKILGFVDSEILPSFISQCELILQEAKPRFAYFYDPKSIYDSDGNFQSPQGFPEYMTCVGFCLNVIKSYLSDEEFFFYQDWNKDTVPDNIAYITKYIEKVQKFYPDVDIEKFQLEFRRILPIEFLAGAYIKSLPVRKVDTDKIKPVLKYILEKNQQDIL